MEFRFVSIVELSFRRIIEDAYIRQVIVCVDRFMKWNYG